MNERTAEEREAARQERERRRAKRDGGAPAPAAPPAQSATDPEPDPDAPPAHDDRHAAPVAAPVGSFADDSEAPSGIRRAFRTPSAATPEAAPDAPAGRVRLPSRRPPAFRGHSAAGRIIAALALLLAVVLVWFLVSLFQPFHGSGQGSVMVTIPKGVSGSKVADLLEREGVVSSSFFFNLRAILAGKHGDLRSGTFHLKRDMGYGAALDILTTPPTPAKVADITITEGKTREQINALLRRQGVGGSYLAASRHSPLLDPRRYGAPRGTPTLEGFLFPSTYQLVDPISAAALVANQLKTFRDQFALVDLRSARARHESPDQVLIVASMVESEAQTTADRPLIASVIYNRLHNNMPLQIDATVRYATGNYTTPIRASELQSSSPFNTYTHKGLPPTPISNPGLASIQAAAHPARTSFLYFVVKPCGNGEHAFASNYAQFQAAVKRYQAARAQRGGKSPAHC
jgi:uncharacterized YceG family protein